jgi:hypothetical protein
VAVYTTTIGLAMFLLSFLTMEFTFQIEYGAMVYLGIIILGVTSITLGIFLFKGIYDSKKELQSIQVGWLKFGTV